MLAYAVEIVKYGACGATLVHSDIALTAAHVRGLWGVPIICGNLLFVVESSVQMFQMQVTQYHFVPSRANSVVRVVFSVLGLGHQLEKVLLHWCSLILLQILLYACANMSKT